MATDGVSLLPSQAAANRLLEGEPGALSDVVLSVAFRSALISVGLYAAGLREEKLLKGAIYSALAIETFVVGYTWASKDKVR